MHTIDVNAVFSRIPEILGMEEMRLRMGKWVGPYYINRERHKHRRDKMSAWIWNGNVMVGEQGGESMTIQRWLREYGGCATWSDVYSVLDAQRPMEFAYSPCLRKDSGAVYVERSVLSHYMTLDRGKCCLFKWFSSMFGRESAAMAWDRYGVTTDEHGDTVYWYMDRSGRICHDKVMGYLDNGHRDRSRGAWRRFRSGDGYTSRCLFGSHLLDGWNGDVFVVESEKTAMMCSCVWEDCLFLASGGKNTLGMVRDGWILLPDVDGYAEWSARGKASMWFERWERRDGHSDIGDLVELYALAGRLDVLRRDDVRNAVLYNVKKNNVENEKDK